MNETVVNVYEAKTNLSKLLNRVEQGEEIVLGRFGRPVARLVAYQPRRVPRVPRRLAGEIEMAADFTETAGRLPRHHRDPFDRMLIAQAQVQGLTLVTRDHCIRKYEASFLAS